MADVLLLLLAVIVAVAGGFAVAYARLAARRQEKTRLQAARRAARADLSASDAYIRSVEEAATVEELERLAEGREEELCSGSSPASSWPSSGSCS